MQGTSRAKFLQYAQYSDELLQLEIEILKYAAANCHIEKFCANNAWYSCFKPKLCKLVGWSAKDDRLKSMKAYDAAYQYLYGLLPDCHHDSMC